MNGHPRDRSHLAKPVQGSRPGRPGAGTRAGKKNTPRPEMDALLSALSNNPYMLFLVFNGDPPKASDEAHSGILKCLAACMSNTADGGKEFHAMWDQSDLQRRSFLALCPITIHGPHGLDQVRAKMETNGLEHTWLQDFFKPQPYAGLMMGAFARFPQSMEPIFEQFMDDFEEVFEPGMMLRRLCSYDESLDQVEIAPFVELPESVIAQWVPGILDHPSYIAWRMSTGDTHGEVKQ